ncbi:VOC family protein [Arthrobacter sp. Br18]|uniref:VOC family protein n=1 Tax=Arthrobacter sp. Br18 TaxID=1312954 RepID=UPI00047B9DF9|nr:VOC family protein [Arthrobacter sp. Br18]
MVTRLNSYLSFRDTAAPAMEFYQSVFGGKLTKDTYAAYDVSEDPAEQDKLMHAELTTPHGMVLMAADTPNSVDLTVGTNHSLSLSGDDEQELRGYWDKLSDSGTVVEPLMQAPWGDSFGMCVDRFGVHWMVNIAGPAA